MNSLSGAMSISCLRLLTRRNVNSFVESISRTTFLAFSVSCPISPAYNTEVALSNELLIGIPSWFTMTTPITPLWAWILLIVSSTSVAGPRRQTRPATATPRPATSWRSCARAARRPTYASGCGARPRRPRPPTPILEVVIQNSLSIRFSLGVR